MTETHCRWHLTTKAEILTIDFFSELTYLGLFSKEFSVVLQLEEESFGYILKHDFQEKSEITLYFTKSFWNNFTSQK